MRFEYFSFLSFMRNGFGICTIEFTHEVNGERKTNMRSLFSIHVWKPPYTPTNELEISIFFYAKLLRFE